MRPGACGRSGQSAGVRRQGRDFRSPWPQCAEDALGAMYRRLAVGLARGLLRVAERRGRCYPVCLLPGPPGVRAPPCRGAPRGRGSGLLPLLAGEGCRPAGRAGRAGWAEHGDLSAPSCSARLVLEARGGGAGATGRGRGCSRGRRSRDHPAAEASQGEGLQHVPRLRGPGWTESWGPCVGRRWRRRCRLRGCERGEKCAQAEGSEAGLFFLNVFPSSRGAGSPPLR